MYKIIYLFLILSILVFGKLDIDEVNEVLSTLESEYVEVLTFYNNDKSIDIENILTFTSFENANILLFAEESFLGKMIIVNSNEKLKKNRDSIGAIYLKNERTNIIFIEERLKKYNLTLNSDRERYIMTECELNPICLLAR